MSQRERSKRYYEKHKARVLAANKKYRAAHKERYKELQKTWCERNPEKRKAIRNKSRNKFYWNLRQEMFNAYGNACTCCGETEPCFLTLEHLNGDGAKHRKSHVQPSNLLRELKQKGWPKDAYTILCANCNGGKYRNGGICPHEAKRLIKLA